MDDTPRIPPLVDDALYKALAPIFGTELSFAAVDAVWRALLAVCIVIPLEAS